MDGRGYWRGSGGARIAALTIAAVCTLCAAPLHAQYYPVPHTPPSQGQPSQSQPSQGQYVAQPQSQPTQAQPSQGQYAQQPQGQYGPPQDQDTGPSRQAFTLDRVSVEGGVRYGSRSLDFGVGARIGYTMSPGVYFGGLFDYWFGESQETVFPGPGGGTISANYSAWDLLGEVGYDFGVLPTLVIRPFGGFGVVHEDAEVCMPGFACTSASGSDAVGEFGGAVIVSLDGLHLGGEFRVMFAEEAVVIIGANIGTSF